MHSNLKFAPREVCVEKRADGSLLLRSPESLGPTARCATEWLVRWALEAPDSIFLCESKKEGWRRISYLENYGAAPILGLALLNLELEPDLTGAYLTAN